MNQRRFVVGALVAVVAIIIKTSLGYTFKDTSNTGQVIVINAGSSQTTALLYQWNSDLEGDCVREMKKLHKPNTSLTSFEGNLTGLSNFMQGLLTDIERWDLSSSHIPIYVGATAGMRALNESNPDQADEILKLIKRAIDDSPFQEGKVEILSGEDEGLYGWLTVNLLLGAKPDSQSSEFGMESIQTSGALDMGGGSLEVAFESGEDSDERLRLFNRTFLIRSNMSNCYGINWATQRFLALNVFRHYQGGNNFSGALIPNPCVNEHCQGFQDSKPLGTNKMDIFGKNNFSCTQFRDRGFSAVLDPIPDNFTFQFDDFYDKEKCNQVLDPFTNYSACQEVFEQNCLSHPLEFPLSSHTFYAMAAFYYDFRRSLGLEESSDYATAMDKIREVCQEPPSSKTCSQADCFKVSYIMKILTDGLHFNQSNFGNLKFVDKINQIGVSWTHGYACIHAGR